MKAYLYRIVVLLWLASPVHAHDEAAAAGEAETDPWSGTGELGFVMSRGNSDTETINAKAEVVYDAEQWRNRLQLDWLQARDDGEDTAKRFTAGLNSNYKLDAMSYIVGAARYDDDEFSGFNYQSSISIGYGRVVVDDGVHLLKVEAGPGVRIAEPDETGETETDLIARGVVDYSWALSDNASLGNVFLVESGSNNTFFENKLTLTTGITSTLGLKLGVSVRRNSNVAADREKTDFLTTANLVYQFL